MLAFVGPEMETSPIDCAQKSQVSSGSTGWQAGGGTGLECFTLLQETANVNTDIIKRYLFCSNIKIGLKVREEERSV